jgi:hypothetical protein
MSKYPRALGLWNAGVPKMMENQNAEAYIPLPQATRRRICVGLYVIHFLLYDFPALGRAFLTVRICLKAHAMTINIMTKNVAGILATSTAARTFSPRGDWRSPHTSRISGQAGKVTSYA